MLLCLLEHYIFIFGGITIGEEHVDSIYLLDINNDNEGWKKLMHIIIKCPMPGSYIAALSNYWA